MRDLDMRERKSITLKMEWGEGRFYEVTVERVM
jgi:hypothetical protein